MTVTISRPRYSAGLTRPQYHVELARDVNGVDGKYRPGAYGMKASGSGYATVPTSTGFDATNKFSIVAWVRFNAPTEDARIVGRWNAATGKQWMFGSRHSKFITYITDPDYVSTTDPILYGGSYQTCNAASGSAVLGSITRTSTLAAGMTVRDSLGIFQAGTTILSVDSATQVTMSATATGNTTGSVVTFSETASQYARWKHVAMVYDGTLAAASRLKHYFEGYEITRATIGGTIPATLTSGTSPITLLDNLQATLAHVAVYPGVALTAAAVRSDSNWIRQSTGLAAWWPCDDGTGTTLRDVSGNAHHGTLVGDASWEAW